METHSLESYRHVEFVRAASYVEPNVDEATRAYMGSRHRAVTGGMVDGYLQLKVNGRSYSVEVEESTPLLWVLRDEFGLTGTKFGCGMGMCGACTVHLDGAAVRSCTTPVSAVQGAEITTIEGLSPDGRHPIQKAWLHEQVPQCGYCQPGMIMATAAFLRDTPSPSDEQIDQAITNLCRCGTYGRIRRAIHRAANELPPQRTRKTVDRDGDEGSQP